MPSNRKLAAASFQYVPAGLFPKPRNNGESVTDIPAKPVVAGLGPPRAQSTPSAPTRETTPDLPRSSELKNFSSSTMSSELTTTPANDPSGLLMRRANSIVSFLVTWPITGSLI